MTDRLTTLLPAMEIAAFEWREDGTFASLAPLPDWFTRIATDTTFPFLGHVLEEAKHFWRSGSTGWRDWGPVAEVSADGAEFHYRVTAVTAKEGRFLLFQLDRGSDEMRGSLQKVRQRQLDREQARGAAERTLRVSADEVQRVMLRLLATSPTPEQMDLLRALTDRHDAVVKVARSLMD